MDITPHPELGHPKDVYQSDWDKFGLWDLVMKNDEELFRAYSMANHPAEGKHHHVDHPYRDSTMGSC